MRLCAQEKSHKNKKTDATKVLTSQHPLQYHYNTILLCGTPWATYPHGA